MDNRQLDKILSAGALRQIQLQEELLPQDNEFEQIVSSEDFTKKMHTLLAEEEQKRKKLNSRKRLWKAVAAFFLLLAISSGAVLSANASQANIARFFNRYFSISNVSRERWDTDFNTQVANQFHNIYLPTWMPEGMQAVQSKQENGISTITYKSETQTIRFTQYANTAQTFNDNNVAAMQKLIVEKQVYYFSEKGSSKSTINKVIWVSPDNVFLELDSNGSKDDLLKVAQSLMLKKG